MSTLTRRSALSLPLLLAPTARAAFVRAIPAFPDWIGRTALLRGDGGAARLLLAEDGTGMMSVRFFLFCRALPIREWKLAPDGLSVRYSRVSALDSHRIIQGEAQILHAEGQVAWVEAARHLAEFEGFAERTLAGACS